MKVADVLASIKRVFLDTSPVIYYVEKNPVYQALVDPFFDHIDDGSLPAVTSVVTLAECLVQPCRRGQIQERKNFVDLVVNGTGITFHALTSAEAERAAEIRARYNLALADALQVAAALLTGCDAFLTNDLALKRVTEIPILVLDELTI